MLNVNEYYKSESDYLKAEDIPKGKQVQLNIAGLEECQFTDGNKLALSFRGTEKKLVLNKTNATSIASSLGDNAEAWVGNNICVYSTMVDFGGKMVPAIRVDMPRETVNFNQPQQAQQQAQPERMQQERVETVQRGSIQQVQQENTQGFSDLEDIPWQT